MNKKKISFTSGQIFRIDVNCSKNVFLCIDFFCATFSFRDMVNFTYMRTRPSKSTISQKLNVAQKKLFNWELSVYYTRCLPPQSTVKMKMCSWSEIKLVHIFFELSYKTNFLQIWKKNIYFSIVMLPLFEIEDLLNIFSRF